MRGKQIFKMLQAIEIMSRPQGATINEIAQELQTDRRSVYRLRDLMEGLYFPIYEEDAGREKLWKIRKDYIQRLPNITIPDLKLTYSEILALYLLKSTSYFAQATEIEKEIERAFHKLNQLVPGPVLDKIQRIQKLFLSASKTAKDYSGKEDIIDSLADAMLQQRQCLVHYYSFYHEITKKFFINPLCFFEDKGGLYTFVQVPRFDSLRTLAVERIGQIEVRNTFFDYPEDFDPEKLIQTSFDIIFDDPIQASIWIAQDQVKYVTERKFFQDQVIEEQQDGSIILYLNTSGWYDVKHWVLGLGSSAIVLEPEELKEDILEELKLTIDNYSLL